MEKKKQTRIWIWIICALLLAALVAGWRFIQSIADPASAFTTPAPVWTAAPTPTPAPTLSPEELEAQAERALWEEADEEFMHDRVNILMLGWDQSPERDDEGSALYRDEKNNFRSDVLMLLTVDFDDGGVDLISIPRDTLAEIYETTGHWKINAAFAKGGSAAGDGFAYAMKTVENLMGVSIDHYAGVNMVGLKAVVDAMGGVDYDVDKEIKLNGRVLKQGLQHLDGQQVLDYCRARKGYGTDVDRADRQQRMLFAIFSQLQTTKQLVRIPKIYRSVKDYIYTDLSAEQIAALAAFATDLDVESSLSRHTLEGKYINNTPYSNASFYVLDTDALKELVHDVFGATLKPDYRYDYRYVEADAAAATGLEYISAAEYICSLAGGSLAGYGLSFSADSIMALTERDIPDDASASEREALLQQPLDRETLEAETQAFANELLRFCYQYGIYRENVDRRMLPKEFYNALPSLGDVGATGG